VDTPNTVYTLHGPVDNTTKAVFIGNDTQDRQTGIPNRIFRWEVGTYGGEGRIADFLTTDEQLKQCVPYVELSDSAVTYKSFLPSTGNVAPMPFAGNARVRFFDIEGTTELYRTRWSAISFSEGETIEDSISFPVEDTNGNNVAKKDIGLIAVQIRAQAEDGGLGHYIYRWNFVIQDNTVPPPDSSKVNTRATVSPSANRGKINIIVKTMDDSPTLPDVWYKVWLENNNNSTSQSAINTYAASESGYIGPFGVKSQKIGDDATLEIDVNNLLNPDGTPSSEKITTGSYSIIYEYKDTETGLVYVGKLDSVSLAGTDDTPPETSGGGGGCDVGYGLFGLLLAGLVTRKYQKA
jgi:hypothetical protein